MFPESYRVELKGQLVPLLQYGLFDYNRTEQGGDRDFHMTLVALLSQRE